MKMLRLENGYAVITSSILILLFSNVYAQTVSTCWNPAFGTQVSCTAGVTDGWCRTNLTTGVGSCVSSTSNTDPNSLYCNSNDNCNQIVTQCYNPIGRSFVSCDQTGLSTYCQLSFAGPIISTNQFKYATGSCQSSCTPSNTNDVSIVVCCFAQNNCNNIFNIGPHRNGGHGVNCTGRFGGRRQSRGVSKPTTIRVGKRFV